VDYIYTIYIYILFGGRVIEIPFTALQPHHSHPYDLKSDNWRSRTNNIDFTPHLQTFNDIDEVFAINKYPVTPFSRVALQPPRRREPIADFLQYSPPRRVRPRRQEAEDVQNQTVNERPVDVPNFEEQTPVIHYNVNDVNECPDENVPANNSKHRLTARGRLGYVEDRIFIVKNRYL